ncbi:MAG: ATP-binding protein [Dehalococcoidales bacterium]|nr:ATP-binding protein [Dehalococcoidales bacterium]
MEHIGEILKKTTLKNTPAVGTDDSSGTKAETSPSSNCNICMGAGFVHPALPSGKADYSRVVACKCLCRVTNKNRQVVLEKYSNLGSLKRLTFDNLIPQGRNGSAIRQEKFEAAYQAAKKYAETPGGWLVFIGPSGCGKTHLAAAIANERIGKGFPVFFITAADLLDHLRSAFNPESEITYDKLFDQVRNTPLLVLDDLNIQTVKPWAKEKLDQLLNHRFNNELPTIITTTPPTEQLGDRLITRITDTRLCQVFYIEEETESVMDNAWAPGLELQKIMTFSGFDWKRVNLSLEQRENLERVYRLAFEFAKSPDGWLVLQGVTGCGKTHLASAIVNYQYQAKKSSLFIFVPEFLDHLRSAFNPDSKISYDQLFEKVKNTPLLVLDDFGEQTTTPWAREKLYQVINSRYNARLATVITTRCSLDELDSPIRSRFIDPCISVTFHIEAPDYRGDSVPKNPAKSARTYNRRQNNTRG